MNIPLNRLLITATITAIFLFPRCEKAYDYIHHHPGKDVKICQITTLHFFTEEARKTNISYNSYGDPRDIILDAPGFVGWPDNRFRYDKHQRLTDYLQHYHGATGVVIWHHYTYPSAKKIVDSVFNYVGDISDTENPHIGNAGSYYLNVYTLDALGRVIRAVYSSNQNPTVFTTDYVYDSQGNLIRPGVTYDNKLNIYRTNKVWMLIYLDYSINNPLTEILSITAYNEFDLPLAFHSGSRQDYLFGNGFWDLEVTYDCDEEHPGNN